MTKKNNIEPDLPEPGEAGSIEQQLDMMESGNLRGELASRHGKMNFNVDMSEYNREGSEMSGDEHSSGMQGGESELSTVGQRHIHTGLPGDDNRTDPASVEEGVEPPFENEKSKEGATIMGKNRNIEEREHQIKDAFLGVGSPPPEPKKAEAGTEEQHGVDQGGVAATHIMLDYHKRLRGLFRQYQSLDLRESTLLHSVCRQVLMEVEVHSRLDQDLLYPEIQSCANIDGQRVVAEAFSEHTPILEWAEKVRALMKDNLPFDTEIEALIEAVEAHLEYEARVIVPLAEISIPLEQMGPLGMRIQMEKVHLEHLPEYSDSRPEVTQNPNGGEQMRGRGPGEAA